MQFFFREEWLFSAEQPGSAASQPQLRTDRIKKSHISLPLPGATLGYHLLTVPLVSLHPSQNRTEIGYLVIETVLQGGVRCTGF